MTRSLSHDLIPNSLKKKKKSDLCQTRYLLNLQAPITRKEKLDLYVTVNASHIMLCRFNVQHHQGANHIKSTAQVHYTFKEKTNSIAGIGKLIQERVWQSVYSRKGLLITKKGNVCSIKISDAEVYVQKLSSHVFKTHFTAQILKSGVIFFFVNCGQRHWWKGFD